VLEANLSDKPSGCINIKKVALSSAVIGEKAVFTDDSILSDLSVMTATIEKLKLDEVTAIYSSDVNNNYIVYDGRLTIKIGSTDSIEDKIYSALTVIEKLNESNPDAVGEITSNGGKQIYFTEKN
jgi:hypothetical protein